MKRSLMVSLFVLVALAACKPAPPEVAAAPAQLPAPFDAAALQAGLSVGTHLYFTMTAEGAPPRHERWEIVSATDAEAVIRTTDVDVGGMPLGPPQDETFTWTALESHATFPADFTVVRESELLTPMGALPVWIYVVEPPGDEAKADIFYFAPSMPGPPVKMETEADGAIVFTMEMTRRVTPPR